MNSILQPWYLMVMFLTCCVYRQQQEVIEYLRAENLVLKEKLGKQRIRQVIVDLTLQFAKENPTWGCDQIPGEFSKVGYPISDTIVSNILKAYGTDPAPDRKRIGSWATFFKSQ
jgi:hypothetical protein